MTWIQTYTGRKYFPLNPNVDGICIKPMTTDRAESEFVGLYMYLREECKC